MFGGGGRGQLVGPIFLCMLSMFSSYANKAQLTVHFIMSACVYIKKAPSAT